MVQVAGTNFTTCDNTAMPVMTKVLGLLKGLGEGVDACVKGISITESTINSNPCAYECGKADTFETLLDRCFCIGCDGAISLRVVITTARDLESGWACGTSPTLKDMLRLPFVLDVNGNLAVHLVTCLDLQ